MNAEEIMSVNFDTQTVSARELHNRLNIGTPYHKWFPRMCDYGFVENSDYVVTDKNVRNSNGGKQTVKDAEITVDMAKQICMLQRTPEGREVRQYLIDLEKAWNTPEQVMARALKLADNKIAELKQRNQTLLVDNERMKPKEIFADAVSTSKNSILIGDLAKLISQNGYEIGQKRLFEWLRQNGYLMKTGQSRNMHLQRYVQQGLFEIKETAIQAPNGYTKTTLTTKVTGKGQMYFINKFLKGETENGKSTRIQSV